jgi:NAD(P)-dependent dehydrogenase (short-subunit alcohol dehydrogenase family)
MHCPGLCSVFGGLHLREHERSRSGLAFEVADAKLKYSIVNLRVEGPQLSGTLETFYRPRPTAISTTAIAGMVRQDEFVHQRALVVGGSRGLGEAFAKSIACGGGQVCLTYHRGAEDAERVVREIRGAGGAATAIALDALEPRTLRERWPLSEPPTHVYFLATPKIPIRKGSFVVKDLELMLRTYVTGLHATVVAALELGAPSLVVWSPSTTILDGKGGAEYCIAKAAMEELCRHLPSLYPVTVFTPRLPKIETDQTASLIRTSAAAAADIAVAELRRTYGPTPA